MEKVNGEVEKVIIQIFTKEIIKMIAKTELGNLLGQAEMFTRENLKMMSVKVMVRCIGQMEVATKVNGLMVFSMATDE
jgi:pilus assembly protein TadC